MFKVGQTVKTRLGYPVRIIAILDTPASDGYSVIGVREIDLMDREITTYFPNGGFMSSRQESCNDILPLPDVVTQFVHPPIPQRQFDWCASWSDADENDPRRGWGPTEQSAIEDLKLMFPREDEPEPRFHLVDGEVEFK